MYYRGGLLGIGGGGEGGDLRVVQVVQYHHAAVFGTPHGVKLIMITLAE